MTDPIRPERRALSRRTILLGAAGGVAVATAGATSAQAAANYTKVPKLPGEISRMATQISRVGKKPYEVIDVSIAGDRTRLFVPHAAPPSLTVGAGFLWYYHANGSTYAALSSAFQYSADQAVDWGGISICPNYGGSLWVSQPAITAQVNAVNYVKSLWKTSVSFLRSNSGGGALLTYAYGKRLVPLIRGAYIASGVYDMEATYAQDPLRVGPVYNNDPAAVKATNPARLAQSVWAKTRIRITCSQDDQIVPPAQHGTALYNRALPVGKETTIVYHSGEGGTLGHVVPSFTNSDMLTTFNRWLKEGPA